MSDGKFPLSGLRILVVEDDASLLRVLKASLGKKGAIVTTAMDGQEAWSIFEKNEFDMVLSDVQMPNMSGVELLEKIRQRDANRPIFLLITGQAQVSEEEALKLGAAGLVHKPFRLANLLTILEQVIAPKALRPPA